MAQAAAAARGLAAIGAATPARPRDCARRVEREAWLDRLPEPERRLAAPPAVQRSAVEVQARVAKLEARLLEYVETLDEKLPSTERIVAAVDELASVLRSARPRAVLVT